MQPLSRRLSDNGLRWWTSFAALLPVAALGAIVAVLAFHASVHLHSAGLAGGLGPLAVGLAAARFGLSWALTGLVLVPLVILLGGLRGRDAEEEGA